MPDYHVTWDYDINAPSARAAAWEALNSLMDPEGPFAQFDVQEGRGAKTTVDVAEFLLPGFEPRTLYKTAEQVLFEAMQSLPRTDPGYDIAPPAYPVGPPCELCGDPLRPNDEIGEFAPSDTKGGVAGHVIAHAQCGLDKGLELA